VLSRILEELETYLNDQSRSAAQIVGEAADHVRRYQDVRP
jgi:hypothetical protein